MSTRDFPVPHDAGSVLIRNEPVQARSTARLAALLDAAAGVIDEIGFERLTTAMVAERAGASIGTVYRYFPDRIAVLQSLAVRNFDRISERLLTTIRDESHATWQEVVDAVYDDFVRAFRTEPGFGSLRVGDVLDLRPATGDQTANSQLADLMLEAMRERFGLADGKDVRFAFEAAMEVIDALIARAFARSRKGDQNFLGFGREAVHKLLEPHLGARG